MCSGIASQYPRAGGLMVMLTRLSNTQYGMNGKRGKVVYDWLTQFDGIFCKLSTVPNPGMGFFVASFVRRGQLRISKATMRFAEGIVHLWCRVDPLTQIIRDRVVVKEVVSGAQRYLDPNNWLNAQVGGEPLECHQANVVWLATAPANQQHIQDCLGWGAVLPTVAPQQTYRYKLYHEYCAHANLSKVMKNQPKRKKKGAARKGKRQFSEPFLWYMFESLAKACVGMDAAYASNGVVHQ